MMGFFILKVVNYGIIQFLRDAALSVRYGAIMQILEFIFLGGILVIFRPRPLPAFYTVGINEINVRQNKEFY